MRKEISYPGIQRSMPIMAFWEPTKGESYQNSQMKEILTCAKKSDKFIKDLVEKKEGNSTKFPNSRESFPSKSWTNIPL